MGGGELGFRRHAAARGETPAVMVIKCLPAALIMANNSNSESINELEQRLDVVVVFAPLRRRRRLLGRRVDLGADVGPPAAEVVVLVTRQV